MNAILFGAARTRLSSTLLFCRHRCRAETSEVRLRRFRGPTFRGLSKLPIALLPGSSHRVAHNSLFGDAGCGNKTKTGGVGTIVTPEG